MMYLCGNMSNWSCDMKMSFLKLRCEWHLFWLYVNLKLLIAFEMNMCLWNVSGNL